MNQFQLPPRISDGEFGLGEDTISHKDVKWTHLQHGQSNGEGMTTTSVGTAEIAGRALQLVIGYREEDNLPFISTPIFAPVDATSWCSFNFAEVQK